MAKSNDLTDLASLLKTDRKLTRKERRAQALVEVNQHQAAKTTPEEPLRFADYFKPWSDYKAPDAIEVALFREAVKDASPLEKNDRADISRPKPKPHANQRNADELAALEASQLAMYPSPMSWDIGADIEDEQSFIRGAVAPPATAFSIKAKTWLSLAVATRLSKRRCICQTLPRP